MNNHWVTGRRPTAAEAMALQDENAEIRAEVWRLRARYEEHMAWCGERRSECTCGRPEPERFGYCTVHPESGL